MIASLSPHNANALAKQQAHSSCSWAKNRLVLLQLEAGSASLRQTMKAASADPTSRLLDSYKLLPNSHLIEEDLPAAPATATIAQHLCWS